MYMKYFEKKGSKSRFVRVNLEATTAYIEHLKRIHFEKPHGLSLLQTVVRTAFQGRTGTEGFLCNEEIVHLANLIHKMLQFDPQHRPWAGEVLRTVLGINGGRFGCALCLANGASRQLRTLCETPEAVSLGCSLVKQAEMVVHAQRIQRHAQTGFHPEYLVNMVNSFPYIQRKSIRIGGVFLLVVHLERLKKRIIRGRVARESHRRRIRARWTYALLEYREMEQLSEEEKTWRNKHRYGVSMSP